MISQLSRAGLLKFFNFNIAHFADQFKHILRLCFKLGLYHVKNEVVKLTLAETLAKNGNLWLGTQLNTICLFVSGEGDFAHIQLLLDVMLEHGDLVERGLFGANDDHLGEWIFLGQILFVRSYFRISLYAGLINLLIANSSP